jgi:beta-galactosidase
MYKFPFKSVNSVKRYTANKGPYNAQPGLYKSTFNLTKTADTYLDMHGYGKGFVFLNGHNLGKYWYIGPQQTLYIPAGWLHKGRNEIYVFDELDANHRNISALNHPVLNEVVKE